MAPGHHVTLFATADSITTAEPDVDASPCGLVGGRDDRRRGGRVPAHLVGVRERAGEFDIIHNRFDFLPLTYSALVTTPVVTTIQGSRRTASFLSTSATTAMAAYVVDQRRRSPCPHLRLPRHHPSRHRYRRVHRRTRVPASICCSSGGSTRTRGTAACHRGRPALWPPTSIIAGIIQDEAYFRDEVAPHLDGGAVCATSVPSTPPGAPRHGGAHALLHLIDFDEPFGYSVCRGDGLWHTGDRQLRGLDGRTDLARGERLSRSTTSISAVAAVAGAVVRSTGARTADGPWPTVYGRYHDRQVRNGRTATSAGVLAK